MAWFYNLNLEERKSQTVTVCNFLDVVCGLMVKKSLYGSLRTFAMVLTLNTDSGVMQSEVSDAH